MRRGGAGRWREKERGSQTTVSQKLTANLVLQLALLVSPGRNGVCDLGADIGDNTKVVICAENLLRLAEHPARLEEHRAHDGSCCENEGGKEETKRKKGQAKRRRATNSGGRSACGCRQL